MGSEVAEEVSEVAQRVIADAGRICLVPAPPFGEGPRAEFVRSLLAGVGAPAAIDGIGNVVCVLGDGPAEESVVVAAHLDTVFSADTELRLVEGDGRLAAPGIGDNSLAVAALVELARRFGAGVGAGSATGAGSGSGERTLRRPLVLAATVGEEGLGDLRGAKALLDDRPCGTFVALEGMMLDSLTVAAVGSVRLVVTVRGPGGHPWSDRGTPSAVHALVSGLARAVTEVEVLDGAVVVNVGVIDGGTVINAIASEARAEIDLRSEDEPALGAAVSVVERAFGSGHAGLAGLTVSVEQVGHRPAGRMEADHPLVAAARRARERAGLEPAPERASSTDANAALGRGIPAITVGVTTGANAHRLDEYIDLEPVAAGMASVVGLIEELTGDG